MLSAAEEAGVGEVLQAVMMVPFRLCTDTGRRSRTLLRQFGTIHKHHEEHLYQIEGVKGQANR